MVAVGRWTLRLVAGILLLVLAGSLYEGYAACRDARRFRAPGRLVDIGGRRLHIECAGSGSPVVVLEAGATGDSSEYRRILPQLARFTRACAYDRAGMGWSDPSPEPADARALGGDLDALLAAAGVPPPYVLVASSGGGLAVELFAREHPRDVAGLVMLDAITGAVIDAIPEAAERLQRRGCTASLLAHVGTLRLLDPYDLRGLPADRRDEAIALSYRSSTWDSVCSLLRQGRASAAELRAAPALDPDVPLVVIRHDRVGDLTKGGLAEDLAVEPLWQREQARFAALSRHGELVVATGSGHHIRDDRPDLVVSAVAKLVASARSR